MSADELIKASHKMIEGYDLLVESVEVNQQAILRLDTRISALEDFNKHVEARHIDEWHTCKPKPKSEDEVDYSKDYGLVLKYANILREARMANMFDEVVHDELQKMLREAKGK